eukprot:1139494-Pelagomonas_calceolata.AAC.5
MQPRTLQYQEMGALPSSSQPAGFSSQQQAQEILFLEELTQRLNQMGPNSSSQQGWFATVYTSNSAVPAPVGARSVDTSNVDKD